MTSILFFIAGIALGFYLKGKYIVKRTLDTELSEMREEAREALAERTEGRKEKILELMVDEAEHQKELRACDVVDHKKGVTSADVEKLLDVSGGTALKYLNELESEGKIRQIGKTGRGVYYVLGDSL